MKKKAFTLAELLGVIVILSIILLLVGIPIASRLRQGTQTTFESQEKVIKLATENWISENKDSLPQNDGDTVTINVGVLKQEGFVETDLVDPTTGECIPHNTEIKITKSNDKYNIVIDFDSGTDECPDLDSSTPIIYLNGEALEYVEFGSTYVDKGAVAKTSNGVPITNIKVEVTKNGPTINTNQFKEYEITYSATDNGITVKVKRTIIIVDTTPPVITVPEDSTIPSTVTSINLRQGVSATDNADGNITSKIKITTSLTPGILGEYTVLYEVEDNSGNKASVIRTIRIEDKTKPMVYATVQGNPFNSNGWAKANFNVKLTMTDTGGSGPKQILYCKTQNSTCNPVEEGGLVKTITIKDESASNRICAIAVDNAGNKSDRQCFGPYKLDKTRPNISFVNNQTIGQSAGTFNEKTGITLTDNLTPSNQIDVYTSSSLNFATPGNYTINYTIYDLADNVRTATRYVTIVDDVPPTLSLSSSCSNSGNNGWCKGTVTVYINASSDTSGISTRECKIDSGGYETVSGTSKDYSSDGEHTVTCRVKDGSNNWSSEKSISFKIDGTGPSCTNSVSGTEGEPGWWISGITVTGNCNDSTSGCVSNVSTSRNSETCGTTLNPGTVYDNAGNSTTCPDYLAKIDWTAPVISNTGGRYTGKSPNAYQNYFTITDNCTAGGDIKTPYKYCYYRNNKYLNCDTGEQWVDPDYWFWPGYIKVDGTSRVITYGYQSAEGHSKSYGVDEAGNVGDTHNFSFDY